MSAGLPTFGRREATRVAVALVLGRVLGGTRIARADRGDSLRAETDSVIDGRVLSRARRGADGTLVGRAVGLVDAPFPAVMRTLADFAGYARLMPNVTSARVLERSHGRGVLELAVDSFLGSSRIRRADATIEGDDDGAHLVRLVVRHEGGPGPELRVLVARTPGGVRTIVASTVTLSGVAVPASAHVHRGLAVALIANLRRRMRRPASPTR